MDDLTPFTQAGGDATRLALYQTLGDAIGVRAGAGHLIASVNPVHAPIGALGALFGDAATIRAGEDWLREQGCVAAQAPLQMATWFPYRANLGPFEEPPFLGEPQASPMPWLECGYREVARYASALCPNEPAIAYGESKRPDSVTLAPMGDFDEALERIHAIATEAFSDAYAYSPLSLDAMRALYAPLLPHVRPELILFAESEGEHVGFVFGIPDLLNPKSGRFLVKTLAVSKSWRRAGLGAWLVGELHRAGQGLGFTHGIHALMWTGSRSRKISSHGGTVFREYALYMKEL